MKNTALLLGVLIILSGFGWYLFKSVPIAEAPVQMDMADDTSALPAPEAPLGSVDSFAACVAAGNQVMESYPRQCRHEGELFVEPVALPEEPVACTMDAKLCPDGSAVGRVGPNCEFAPCPGEATAAESVTCSPESKTNQVCTREYTPVCGLVEVQCVTTPCPPVLEAFSNGCTACGQGNVVSYTPGECQLDNI